MSSMTNVNKLCYSSMETNKQFVHLWAEQDEHSPPVIKGNQIHIESS